VFEIFGHLRTLEPDPVNTGVGIGPYPKTALHVAHRVSFIFIPHAGINNDNEREPMKKIMRSILNLSPGYLVISASCLSLPSLAAAPQFEEVLVTSQFRNVSTLDLASSVSVLPQAEIQARGADNLDQLLNMAPNVNYAAGASRGRFVQIRGIGERSQFIDPINPSVGLMIDGIDFTGLGLSANTLDIQQVEILRGPQGTLYGANALAGLINLKANDPTDKAMASISSELAEYDTYKVAAVVSGPLTQRLQYRIAAQNNQSNGYVDNDYLNRDDTNAIDETTMRGKLRFESSDSLRVDVSALYLDVDNGYDAFSLDNSRHTLSDQPGWDRQESLAGSVKTLWSGSQVYTVEALVSVADTETEYGYDEDWVYEGFHPDGYSSTDNYERNRDNASVDLRLISKPEHKIFEGKTSWVAGVYFREDDESLLRNDWFKSNFKTQNQALYGQLRTTLTHQLDWVTGLRVEQRNADYDDNAGVVSDQDEDLWGGNLSLEYQATDAWFIYGLLSRGYKAGGVNGAIISAAETNPAIAAEVFEFDTETMLNYELGAKASLLDNHLQLQAALFYQDRDDVQAKQSIFNPDDFSFDDYLDNAAGGKTTGVEWDINYLASDKIRLFANVGWLNAEFEDFLSSSHVDARDDFTGDTLNPVDLDGREVAHAPQYQFFAGTEISITRYLLLRVEVEGKDEFYFSNSHNEKSAAFELFNARLTYHAANWDIALWGRNLTDKEYYTRGFYFSNQFGNNPDNGYAPEVYHQFAEPRIFGVSANYNF
jgi:outer membrane receptor protein involved in Fe transport